ETLGKPVVAAINGAALGGGFEIALAAHHRVVVDDPGAVVGFPEVQLGLLPGGGGVVRTVRMLGIVDALMQLLLQGQRLRPAQAKELGVVDEIVASGEELIPAAKKWIAENPEAHQPWDEKGYKIPGGTPSTPSLAMNLPAFPANLRKQLKGANYPAPHHIMAVAVESAQLDIDNAFEVEGRYFVDLVVSQVAKNMIQAFFFDLQAVSGARNRPVGIEPFQAKKVVVLGAGMMGAAIALVCAKAGIDVVLKDVSLELAERGKEYATRRAKSADVPARITPTGDPADLAGVDFVIEAVFESQELKHRVFGEGVAPASIEQAGAQAGYPAAPLQLMDELTLTLPRKIRQETRAAVEAAGSRWRPHPADAVIDKMIDEYGRQGRSSGAGFYDY